VELEPGCPLTTMLLSLKHSLVLFNVPLLAHAYSWNFQAPPKQCSDLTVSITGDGGKPPYNLFIIPIGPTPFSNTTEVRRITSQQFNGDDTSVTLKLNFPANSQLVAVVSADIFYHYFHFLSCFWVCGWSSVLKI
jgi:hypothetical protein